MSGFFARPPGYGPAKLGFLAVLGFVLTAVTMIPALDQDAGIPDRSLLIEARGRVAAVDSSRYGVKFRLHGLAGTFAYPSKARGMGVVESTLLAAGDREIGVLFEPEADPASSAYRYTVWQIAIDGKVVRSFDEVKEEWRSDNAVARWLCGAFFLGGIYFAVLAVRARRAQVFR